MGPMPGGKLGGLVQGPPEDNPAWWAFGKPGRPRNNRLPPARPRAPAPNCAWTSRPKAALALSSLGTREELQKAIEQRDATFFAGVKGIGTKKIQKVMVELTGKFDKIPQEDDSKDKEVLDALVNLGFPLQRARDALSQIPQEVKTTEEKIRAALKIIKG